MSPERFVKGESERTLFPSNNLAIVRGGKRRH
jgi:hypothetical protein